MSTQTKHFTKAQAYTFGHKLGLSTATINDLIAEMEATRGNEIVMQVFDEVDREHIAFRDSLLESVTLAVISAKSDIGYLTSIPDSQSSQLHTLEHTTSENHHNMTDDRKCTGKYILDHQSIMYTLQTYNIHSYDTFVYSRHLVLTSFRLIVH